MAGEFSNFPGGVDEMPPMYAAVLAQHGFSEVGGEVVKITEAGLPQRIDLFEGIERAPNANESPLDDEEMGRILQGLHRLGNQPARHVHPGRPAPTAEPHTTSHRAAEEPRRAPEMPQPRDEPPVWSPYATAPPSVAPTRTAPAPAGTASGRATVQPWYRRPTADHSILDRPPQTYPVISAPPAPEQAGQPQTGYQPYFDRVRDDAPGTYSVPVIPGPEAARAPAPHGADLGTASTEVMDPVIDEDDHEGWLRHLGDHGRGHTFGQPAPGDTASRRGVWSEASSDAEQERRLSAWTAPEEPKHENRLVALGKRLSAALMKAAQPVMEDERPSAAPTVATAARAKAQPQYPTRLELLTRTPTQTPPPRPTRTPRPEPQRPAPTRPPAGLPPHIVALNKATHALGKLPDHITVQSGSGQRVYLVEHEQIGKLKQLGRAITFRSRPPERIRSMWVDLDNEESVQDARHMFGLQHDNRRGDTGRHHGIRRYREAPKEVRQAADQARTDYEQVLKARAAAERPLMSRTRFMAKSLGYAALGGGAGLGIVLGHENPQKIADAVETARRLVEAAWPN